MVDAHDDELGAAGRRAHDGEAEEPASSAEAAPDLGWDDEDVTGTPTASDSDLGDRLGSDLRDAGSVDRSTAGASATHTDRGADAHDDQVDDGAGDRGEVRDVPQPPATGDTAIDEAMVELAEAQAGSFAERIDAGERAHQLLQGRLNDLGGA